MTSWTSHHRFSSVQSAMAAGGQVAAVESVFIGAGCNRIVNNVSWGLCGLVAFGAQNAVALFSPNRAQILTTLRGHSAVVNCTHWLPASKDICRVQHVENHFLLSGSADGVIMVWVIEPEKREWRHVLQVRETHKKGVTCLSGIMFSSNVAKFASTSSDGIVNLWEIILPSNPGGDCKITCLESISVGSKPMVSLSLAQLPGESGELILAMGGLDQKVHLYCNDRAGKLVHACELKGHTDWIRSLDFSSPVYSSDGRNSFYLVSSSQDRSIRIWKMSLLESGVDHDIKKRDISLASYIDGPILVAGFQFYQVSLESLLIGHEDWVYSVQWQPPLPVSPIREEKYQPMSILSASMDKTMMIWKPERTTGIWINVVNVGELSHSALGFYGGHWSADGESILAHGYGGSFHLWTNIGVDCENWQPQIVPSGHFSSVSDIAWSRCGNYMVSVSHDQTTRVFANWKNRGSNGNWHEIARPQVHGHDINCVAIIKGKGNHRFVSGADEKVARVFEAPLSFLKTLQHATLQNSSWFEDLEGNIQILGANMSALGLSQKPIFANASNEASSKLHHVVPDSLETIPDAVPIALTEPPIEEQLAWHTLWPESHKLYGHGNELYSICCNQAGKLVASSCKAQSAAVAEIWLWEVGSWKAVGRLQCHSLTVTQMEFSHDDAYLLAVSRDRQFSVFSIKNMGDEVQHQLIAKHEAHKRIIWSCSWNPFCHQFATGSRDKTVKIWGVEEDCSIKQLLTIPQLGDSVTALSWVGRDRNENTGLIAIGLDNGLIELWTVSGGLNSIPFIAKIAVKFDPFLCHVSTVHRLAWRKHDANDSKSMELASCGADHCVRLFQVVCSV